MKNIYYVHEPDEFQCGQAVLSMVTGFQVEKVAEELHNDRETNLREMKSFLRAHGVWISDVRVSVKNKEDLKILFTFYQLLISFLNLWYASRNSLLSTNSSPL